MNKISLDKLMSLTLDANQQKSPSDNELLEVFDVDGNLIGVAPRLLCHRLGLIHQVVYLMIESDNGRLLLQTRGDTKDGRLDIAVGGHVAAGEQPVRALLREVNEEIGLVIDESRLVHIATYKRYQHPTLKKPNTLNREIRHVFVLSMNDYDLGQLQGAFSNRAEKGMVRNISWFDTEQVLNAIDESRTADGLAATFPHYLFWKLVQQTQR